jgi:hypothetical protein
LEYKAVDVGNLDSGRIAFGGFGVLLEGMEYLSGEMAMADSLSLDGEFGIPCENSGDCSFLALLLVIAHKWLQVSRIQG